MRRLISNLTAGPRYGITLIEVVVAIAIAGILVAIAIPAVQASRRAANKVACSSQLRQIAIACESYTGVMRSYPPKLGGWEQHLLTYLGMPENQQTVTLYACPSDREHSSGDLSLNVSYAMNDGQGEGYRNGICSYRMNPVSPAEVTDGLSTTAMFSERLSSPWFGGLMVDWDEHKHLWNRTLRRMYADHDDLDAVFDECEHRAGPPAAGHFLTSAYHHVMPPNHNSCKLYPSDENPDPRTYRIVTAGSPHSGGTHTVFCDGSLRFISDQIDVAVWRAIGSRNGGETDANDAF